MEGGGCTVLLCTYVPRTSTYEVLGMYVYYVLCRKETRPQSSCGPWMLPHV